MRKWRIPKMPHGIFGFIVFFVIFFFVYLGAHLYVFHRLSSLFAINSTWWGYLILAVLALSFPVMSYIERVIDGQIARVFYTLSTIWLGTLFFLFCSLLVYELISLFTDLNSKSIGIIILLGVGFLVVFSLVNSFFLNVKTIEIPMPNLEKEINLVQLSDVHVGTIYGPKRLQRIVEKTNELNPEMVMITGDLLDGTGILSQDSFSPLNKLNAKTFFTIGNHEQYEGIDEVMKLLGKTKVEVLRNKLVEYKGIQVIGIDNPLEIFAKNNVNNTIDSIKIDKNKPSVLLYHPPQGMKKASEAGVNLQLSGHTHNGQIIPFNFLIKLFFRNTKGLYNYNGMHLYVSPGTGTWGPPFRLGSQNEITLIKLIKE